jgi:hypothetical protein
MHTSPGDSRRPPPTRFPKGPLIVILLVLASMAWVYWLTRATPRPPPELPPLRQLPLESLHEQERPDPAKDPMRERQ